jgi:hypothetical protein
MIATLFVLTSVNLSTRLNPPHNLSSSHFFCPPTSVPLFISPQSPFCHLNSPFLSPLLILTAPHLSPFPVYSYPQCRQSQPSPFHFANLTVIQEIEERCCRRMQPSSIFLPSPYPSLSPYLPLTPKPAHHLFSSISFFFFHFSS